MHYDNPEAPKGCVARQIAVGTFDISNIVVAGVRSGRVAKKAPSRSSGRIPRRRPRSTEVSTEYGALAEAVSHPDDFSFVTYRLRPQAKWHDGKPVTADDVIFSLDAFRSTTRGTRPSYSHVVKAEKVG